MPFGAFEVLRAGSRPSRKERPRCKICTGKKMIGYWKIETVGRFKVRQKRWAYKKCSACGGSGRKN